MMLGSRPWAIASLLLTCGCWHAEIAKDDMLPPLGPPIWAPPSDGGIATEPPLTLPVANDLFVSVQPGPVVIFVRRQPPRLALIPERAALRIDLPAGHAVGPAVSEVLAQAVTELPAAGGPSLREAIQGLGGELTVRVGLDTASFIAAVPVKDWAFALRTMVERLKQLNLTRGQLARLKQKALRRELAARAVSPLLSLVGHLLRSGVADPNPVLDHLEDCSLPQLALLHAKYYQPRNMRVGLWVPGEQAPEAVKDTAVEVLRQWQASESTTGPVRKPVPEPAAVPGGIHWVVGPGPSQVALVLPVAPSAELMVLQQVLSLDGVGGRLGRHLRRSLGFEPAFQAHHVGGLRRRFMVLETTVQPELVIPVWRALEQARVSMIRDKPQGLELKVGIDRVRLLLLARDAEADAWLEAAAVRVPNRHDGGPAQDFAALVRLHSGDVALELPAFARLSPIMIVLGGTPPADTGVTITRGTNALAGSRAQGTQLSTSEREAEARKHLDHAVRAVGGERDLRLLQGFRAKARRRARTGLETTEKTWYRMPDHVRRITKVLQTEIETVVHKDQGIERCGGSEKRLTPGEAMNMWLELARHPLTLLAEHTRGKARYHLVGVRRIAGRDIAILERVGADQLRLRLLLDSESGLPRVVESWEQRSGIGLVEVRERYEDYRTVGGLRVPHYRQAALNDSGPVIETLWESFVPEAPDDTTLKPGGGTDKGR